MRGELVRVAAQLQAKTGKRVDYDQVIHYLLSEAGKDEHLLREACKPVPVALRELRRELRRERADDQKREKTLEIKCA